MDIGGYYSPPAEAEPSERVETCRSLSLSLSLTATAGLEQTVERPVCHKQRGWRWLLPELLELLELLQRWLSGAGACVGLMMMMTSSVSGKPAVRRVRGALVRAETEAEAEAEGWEWEWLAALKVCARAAGWRQEQT